MRLTQTHKFFDLLLLFLLVFSGGGLLFVLYRNLFSIILLVVSSFVLFFMGKGLKRFIFNASLFGLLFFSALVLLNYILAPGSQKFLKYGFHLMNITSCVIIFTHFKNSRNNKYFLSKIRFVLKIILYYSVLNFLAYFIVKGSLTEVYGGWNNDFIVETFNYIFFYVPEKHVFNIFGFELVRNQGWFWEPGVNQVYLNILLYLEGFVFKRNKWIILLIVFAIFTTYSTTGIFIMLIVLIFIFWKSIRRNPILIFLAIAFMIPIFYVAKMNIERKSTEKASSMNKRIFDLVQPLAIAIDNPLTGVGLDVEHFQKYRSEYNLDDETQELLTTETTEKGSSNSITFLLAAMGFPVSFFLLYCLFKQTLFTHRKGIFMTIIIISVLSEPLLLRPFFLIFIVSGMIAFFTKFTK